MLLTGDGSPERPLMILTCRARYDQTGPVRYLLVVILTTYTGQAAMKSQQSVDCQGAAAAAAIAAIAAMKKRRAGNSKRTPIIIALYPFRIPHNPYSHIRIFHSNACATQSTFRSDPPRFRNTQTLQRIRDEQKQQHPSLGIPSQCVNTHMRRYEIKSEGLLNIHPRLSKNVSYLYLLLPTKKRHVRTLYLLVA